MYLVTANAQTLLDIFCYPVPSCSGGSFLSFNTHIGLVGSVATVTMNCLNMVAAISTGKASYNTDYGGGATI